MSHTRAPWAWRRFGDTYTLHADHGRRDTIIGAIPHGDMKYPVVAMSIAGRLLDVDPEHPNALVIQAAPDLLEALEGLSDLLNNHYGDDPYETQIIQKAFTAMNKAKGL